MSGWVSVGGSAAVGSVEDGQAFGPQLVVLDDLRAVDAARYEAHPVAGHPVDIFARCCARRIVDQRRTPAEANGVTAGQGLLDVKRNVERALAGVHAGVPRRGKHLAAPQLPSPVPPH